MKLINSIKVIADFYDNFIIDQWGVMHDGLYGYKHAIEALDYLEKNNKNLFIISNSSKRKNSSVEKLHTLGFKKNSFVNVHTSGEMIWNTIKKNTLNLLLKKNVSIFMIKQKMMGLFLEMD